MNDIQEAASFLRERGVGSPQIGVVLGTGLGQTFLQRLTADLVLPYMEIPHFPVATVDMHRGRLHAGDIEGKRVLVMEGRFHYYEGHSMQQITFPIRVMKLLGVKYLLISNAAGSLNRDWKKGELMLIDDHINLLPDNPLRGRNVDALGPRFPDMSQPYSPYLNGLLRGLAAERKITLREGVYASVSGPNLETRAEYRFLSRIGADAVGMSTVPEVIVAHHMALPTCAVSVLTDECDPDHLEPVKIEDIIATAARAEPLLTELFVSLIRAVDADGGAQ